MFQKNLPKVFSSFSLNFGKFLHVVEHFGSFFKAFELHIVVFKQLQLFVNRFNIFQIDAVVGDSLLSSKKSRNLLSVSKEILGIQKLLEYSLVWYLYVRLFYHVNTFWRIFLTNFFKTFTWIAKPHEKRLFLFTKIIGSFMKKSRNLLSLNVLLFEGQLLQNIQVCVTR